MSSFCRHNRFISECPICAKGTVLDPTRPAGRPRSSTAGSRGGSRTGARRATSAAATARPVRGPYAAVGPYEGRELRLERVPGGLRLASWHGGQLERAAPLLAAEDLPRLLAEAVEKELLSAADVQAVEEAASAAAPASAEALAASSFGRSPGRSGELRDELRLEALEDGQLRLARWLQRPNRGWELQEAPVLLPPVRFAQALADAARRGVLTDRQPIA